MINLAHKVKCRACGNYFDRDLLLEDVDWVMPSKNHYYHKNCYEQWARRKQDLDTTLTNDEWFEALKYYLNHEIKAPIDYRKMTSQWNNFLKQKKTAKGIYFAMRYFYDVAKGNKEQSQGGIGIVSFIYQDSCYYWEEKFKHDNTVLEKIERQIRDQLLQKTNLVKQTKKVEKRRKAISLDDIE